MLWEACLLWGVVYLDCVLIWSMMHPEAFLHPEVELTLAWCISFHHSALVTELSEALSLDVVNSLTLRVIFSLSTCASLNLIGSAFTWRSRLTVAWSNIYSIALRQSKSHRKQLRFRLNHSLVLGFVHLKFMD